MRTFPQNLSSQRELVRVKAPLASSAVTGVILPQKFPKSLLAKIHNLILTSWRFLCFVQGNPESLNSTNLRFSYLSRWPTINHFGLPNQVRDILSLNWCTLPFLLPLVFPAVMSVAKILKNLPSKA